MGNKLNKIYEKSMDNYNKGYIEKALEECEKGISLNLKDVRLLNLKGMLLYIKGDLKGAIAVWKINKDYNNDEISKIYIRDAKKDEENIKLYSLAEHDIKELRIDNAIEKLEKCRVSDFNSINVNNALSICYLRKGNYLKAMEFNEASLIINKEGRTALEIRNQINGYLQDPVDEFKNSIKKKSLIILLILLGVIAIFIFLNINKKDEGLSNNTENIVANEEIINKEIINEEVNNEEVNNEEVNNEEKNTQVNKLNSEEEIKKAYEESIGLFDEKKYDESIKKLQSAYNSDVDTYYRKHVLFLLASCYYEKNQINEAIQYYEEYIGKYDETYIEEIYYKLALAYENIDLNKSKEYANYIKNKFSNSIYNNSKISQIIYK
ncbi:tetratricopeptide repeat protein [uncultured Clostridium sp.]|uniref:tetratricopeptide repeat protein n=1 Tax=uncultured Clostridium sp. TaxID=59620 RepID=UPI00267395E6|nr:tetratricopeptide repeat protein [uncultured Clostridium sp.]